jgi:KUP system potassium uptake protein
VSDNSRSGVLALSLGATGVVFGDIGTSPLYAFRESFANGGKTPEDVFGVVSLIFWALMIVVTVKYLLVVMRADNHGDAGILSLLALTPQRIREHATRRECALFLLVLVGTALLFGDGILTPAISVLSATEGLSLVNLAIGGYAVQIAVVILVLLFAVQSRGTHRIGQFFGPVMVIWFLSIAGLGIYRLLGRPEALRSLSPTYGID